MSSQQLDYSEPSDPAVAAFQQSIPNPPLPEPNKAYFDWWSKQPKTFFDAVAARYVRQVEHRLELGRAASQFVDLCWDRCRLKMMPRKFDEWESHCLKSCFHQFYAISLHYQERLEKYTPPSSPLDLRLPGDK
jgi:hypothetical protein